MKKSKICGDFRKWIGVLALSAALAVGMMGTEITAYAESAGKVTATTAKIRKEASTSSDVVGSTESGKTVSIKGQTTGDDGYTWYQVWVDDTTLGYIRSDLVSITDGSTPATLQSTTTTTTTTTTTGGSTATTSTPDETVVDVTAVNAVSASVSGGSPVRVRQNASTTSRIVTTVEGGSALTVNGTATGTDGNQWYQVNFTSGGSEVNGFIRADYVTLSGELTVVSETTEAGTEDEAETTETEGDDTETSTKDWDTYQSDDGLWHLQNNTSGESYSITDIFDTVKTNTEIANSEAAANKTLRTVVIILVVLMVAAVAAIGFLIFRLKDMTDSAYYREVEQETMRRRTGTRTQNGRTTAERTASGQRTDGRPTGQGQTRAAGSGQHRPAAGQGQARNASASGGQRQAGNRRQTMQEQTGSAESQHVTDNQRQTSQSRDRAEGTQQRTARREEEGSGVQENAAETTAQHGAKTSAQSGQTQKPGWKSKNFVADDDEFEFEFLNWDGDEE